MNLIGQINRVEKSDGRGWKKVFPKVEKSVSQGRKKCRLTKYLTKLLTKYNYGSSIF